MNLQPIAHIGHEMQVEERVRQLRPVVRNRRDPGDWENLLVTLADDDKVTVTTQIREALYCKTCDLYLGPEWSWQ